MKYIFGIDPGTIKSGYILLSLSKNNIFDILDKNHIDNNKIKRIIINKYISYHTIEVAIETIVSYGMRIGQSTIETAIWAGRFFQIMQDLGIEVQMITRPDVKLNLCHDSRAKDKNVTQAIKDRFGNIGTKNNQGRLYSLKTGIEKGGREHVLSALAVATTYIDKIYGKCK